MKLDLITEVLLNEYEPDSILGKMAKYGIGQDVRSIKTAPELPGNPTEQYLAKGITKLFNGLPRDLQNKIISDTNEINPDSSIIEKIMVFLVKHNLINLNAEEKYPISVTSGGVAAVVGTIAVIAFLSYVAKKIFDDIFGKGEKLCSKYKGEQKEKCLSTYRAKAFIESNKALMRSIKLCNKAKNKNECIQKIKSKIQANQEKIRNISQKIKY